MNYDGRGVGVREKMEVMGESVAMKKKSNLFLLFFCFILK